MIVAGMWGRNARTEPTGHARDENPGLETTRVCKRRSQTGRFVSLFVYFCTNIQLIQNILVSGV